MSDGGEDLERAQPLYKIGYRKPPMETRWKPGQSGNPSGRPRKSDPRTKRPTVPLLGSDEPTRKMILDEAYRKVRMRDGDRVIEMPVNAAVLRAMSTNAIKGSRLAQRDWTALVQQAESDQRSSQMQWFQTLAELKIRGEEELERYLKEGREPPEMIPHPEDIFLDFATGSGEIRGPFTRDDKKKHDAMLARRDEAQTQVSMCRSKHVQARSEKSKESWLAEWHSEQRIFDLINDQLPDRYQRELADRSYRPEASMPSKVEAMRRKMRASAP